MTATDPRPVLLACAHGTRSVAGRRAVGGLVAAVGAAAGDRVEVRAAYVDVQPPAVPNVLAGLAGRDVVVVPRLLSAGYHVHGDQTEAVTGRDRVRLAPALGPDPRIVTVLERRLRAAGLIDDDTVVLSSAGSSDARAVTDCRRVADALAARVGRPVTAAFLSAADPTTADAVAAGRAEGRRVLVADHLLAPGFFADRSRAVGADAVTGPLLGDPATGDAPPPELVDLVLERAGLR